MSVIVNTIKKPLNSRKKWDDSEENEIIAMLSSDASIDEIAKKLERSKYSIRLRIESLAVRAIKNGKSIEEVAKLTNLNDDYINECITKCDLADKRRKINENVYNDITSLKEEHCIFQDEIHKLNEKIESLEKKMASHEKYIKVFTKHLAGGTS